MNRWAFCAACALVVLALVGETASAQNQLANSGFESPITSDGAPFVGFWEGFAGGGASAANSPEMPRSGTQSLMLAIAQTDNTFAGVFQDVPNLTPGMLATFSGFHKTTSSPLDLDTEVRIEWRNSVSNSEVGRTPNLSPVPTGDYGPFSLSAAVPAGADTARVVYAIQTFTGGPSNTGTVFIDDVSFVVPEPSVVALAGVTALGLLRRRRARA